MIRSMIVFAILIFILFPFIALLSFAPSWRLPLTSEILEVFAFTFQQAVLSALFSVMFGVAGSFGLFWLVSKGSVRVSKVTEALVLLPNVAPVLLLLLSVIKFFPFARGLTGILLVHTLLNAGIVSAAFVRLVREKVSGMAELAWIEGASGRRFFMRGVLPLLWHDLALMFLFVFALCFASFSVPLMIGGSRATTLEVLIYEKIRISGDWGSALGIATLQMTSILALSWLLRRKQSVPLASREAHTPLLSWAPGLLLVLIAPVVLILGLLDGVIAGATQVSRMDALLRELPSLFTGSMVVAVGTGLLAALFLLALAYVNPKGIFRRFLIGYAAPSSALMGFALLIAIRGTGPLTYIKLMVGITLITVPSFYRLRWDSVLQSLEGQRQVAWILGASEGLVFKSVVLPQVISPACFIAGLASLWAWGDFALSAVVAERAVTVAMLVQGLMGSYRLDAATVLVWLLILGGALTFALFNGVGRVFGSKPQA